MSASSSVSVGRFLCLDDFEKPARRHLPRCVYEYIAGGAETGATLRANRQQFEAWAFRPAALRDTAERSANVEVLDSHWRAPFGIAPMGACGLAAFRADLAMAGAAAEAGVPFVLSGASLIRMERILELNPDTWFQAYLPPEPDAQLALIERARVAGHRTLVITTDVPVPGYREADIRNGYTSPLRPSWRLLGDGVSHPRWVLGTLLRTLFHEGMPHFENFSAEQGGPMLSAKAPARRHFRDQLNWQQVARLRERWPHRLILKGLLDPADALRAQALGVDALWLSNHGGRQLDGAATPLAVLPDFRRAVSLPLLCDSGFRRGTDVLKALALGASMVFIGRPFLFAVVAAGQAGVARAIQLLQQEIDRDLALLGCVRPEEVSQRLMATPARP